MSYSFERKGLHSTGTGTVDDMDALSLIGFISVLEVFRLNQKVVCYRHSLPLHDFRRLVLHAKISECSQRFAGPLEWRCGHKSSIIEKTIQDVAIRVPGEK